MVPLSDRQRCRLIHEIDEHVSKHVEVRDVRHIPFPLSLAKSRGLSRGSTIGTDLSYLYAAIVGGGKDQVFLEHIDKNGNRESALAELLRSTLPAHHLVFEFFETSDERKRK